MVYLLEYHRHAVTGTIYIYLTETNLPDIRQNSPTRQGLKGNSGHFYLNEYTRLVFKLLCNYCDLDSHLLIVTSCNKRF